MANGKIRSPCFYVTCSLLQICGDDLKGEPSRRRIAIEPPSNRHRTATEPPSEQADAFVAVIGGVCGLFNGIMIRN